MMSRFAALPVVQLADHFGRALHASAQETLGRPIALALRWRDVGDGVFVSGVPHDLVDRIAAAFGATVAPADGREDALFILDECWTGDDGMRAGTGPVPVAPGTAGAVPLCMTAPAEAEPASKLDQAKALRERLRERAELLTADLDALPDARTLAETALGRRSALAPLLRDVAAARELVGRYLLDAGDLFDDERIDQLGDGYVRAAKLWSEAASQPETVDFAVLVELERMCARWMAGAAEPPTRYAF